MGVWIETSNDFVKLLISVVTPHVGVWIETCKTGTTDSRNGVTPHVGVWIETNIMIEKLAYVRSLPMWECGLKQSTLIRNYGDTLVTPHVGVWIETRNC